MLRDLLQPGKRQRAGPLTLTPRVLSTLGTPLL